jgi:glucose/mannose transport system permease protein
MAVTQTSLPATTRKASRRISNRDLLLAILVLLPSIIAVAIFIYTFIAWTFYISTVNWNTSLVDYTSVGLQNWQRMLTSFRFQIDLRNLVLYAAGFMTQCILIGFLLASILDQHIKGEAVFRTIFIFPFAISAVVTGVAWRWLMRPETGINALFEMVGLGFLRSQWFAHPTAGILFITIASAWQFSGYVMALYLAGLRGIPLEVKEAAQMDGCNTWNLYRHIIIPMLAPVTFTVIVLTGMASIRVFDIVTVMSGTGRAFSTDMFSTHMFELMFTANRFSLAAVIGAFMIILSAFLVVPYLLSVRKEQER